MLDPIHANWCSALYKVVGGYSKIRFWHYAIDQMTIEKTKRYVFCYVEFIFDCHEKCLTALAQGCYQSELPKIVKMKFISKKFLPCLSVLAS